MIYMMIGFPSCMGVEYQYKYYTHTYIQSNLYIKATQGTENVAFMNSLKFHVQLINGENETILYRE